MQLESGTCIVIPPSSVQKRVIKAAHVSKRTHYVEKWKKAKMWKIVHQWHFQLHVNWDQKSKKSVLDYFE
jgi:hypothetical protein